MTRMTTGAALLCVLLAACTTTASVEAPTVSPSSSGLAEATALPSTSSSAAASASSASSEWVPGDPVRVKVVVQLSDPVTPDRCADPGDDERIAVGSPVELTTSDGSPIATLVLREVMEGEPFGPQGYTFGGWSDLEPNADGVPVTYACFYIAEAEEVPVADGYIASVAGGQDLVYDVPTLQESEGWILQLVS